MARQIQTLTLAFFFIIILLSTVQAIAFKENTDIDIRHAVRLDGAIPSSADCNITVYSPNNTVIIDFQEMTDGGDEFNYTINSSLLVDKGEYSYDVTCNAGTHSGTETFTFFVNLGGVEPTQERTDALSRTLYFIFGIGIILFVGFFIAKTAPVKWTYFLLATLFILIGVNMIFLTLQDEVVNPSLETFFSAFTTISFILYWFIGFLIFGVWTLTAVVTIFRRMQSTTARRLEQ